MPKINWSEYNRKLDHEVADVFVDNALPVEQGKDGCQYRYSNTLILILLAVKEYLKCKDTVIQPDICRRQKKLGVPINIKHEGKGPVDIAIDSTGIKVFNRGNG